MYKNLFSINGSYNTLFEEKVYYTQRFLYGNVGLLS